MAIISFQVIATSIFILHKSASAFMVNHGCLRKYTSHQKICHTTIIPHMSFFSESSEYSSSESDSDVEEDDTDSGLESASRISEDDESPTIEESPVPMSKNAGNRFVAFIFDRTINILSGKSVDPIEMHENRILDTEQHVFFCRKTNLYNETFNTESIADVVWSHQLLSSDLRRTIGHAMCIEAKTLENARTLLSQDPIIQRLTHGDISNIPLYRWRHIRDSTLRQDDGRGGSPTLVLALDHSSDTGGAAQQLRTQVTNAHLEYLIRSERVIAAGPLHVPTEMKDDPSSIAIGDLVLFNAPDREDAIHFVENDPAALAGLYQSMRVHRYNSLDVSGKFVAMNLVYPEKNKPTADMKEAMEQMGYPVDDRQTKWINW